MIIKDGKEKKVLSNISGSLSKANSAKKSTSSSSSNKANSAKKSTSSSSSNKANSTKKPTSSSSLSKAKRAKSSTSSRSLDTALRRRKVESASSLDTEMRRRKVESASSLDTAMRRRKQASSRKAVIKKLSEFDKNMFGKIYRIAYLELYLDISAKEIEILNKYKGYKLGFNKKATGGKLAKFKGGVNPFGLVRNLTSANSSDRDVNTYMDNTTRQFFQHLWIYLSGQQPFPTTGDDNININLTPIHNVGVVLRRRNTNGKGVLDGYQTYTYSIIINISNILHWTLFHEIDKHGETVWRVDRLHMTMSQWQDNDDFHHDTLRIYFPYTESIIQVIHDHEQLGSMYVLARLMLGGAYNLVSKGRSLSDKNVRTELFSDISTELINASKVYPVNQISTIAEIHNNFISAINFPPEVINFLNPMQNQLNNLIKHVALLGY